MSKPLVSIVIPAYNHQRYIGQAIESALGQTHEHLEVVIVDDGSTDATPDVIRRYTDKRLSCVRQENADAYNAINRGLDLAKGSFIAILNDDDLYLPNRIERLLEAQAASKAACLFTDVEAMDAEGHAIAAPSHQWNVWHGQNRAVYFESGDLYTAFLHGNFLVTTSNLFLTAEAVASVGRFAPLRYLHDYDFMFRILAAYPGGTQYLHEDKLLRYRIHGGNTLAQGAIAAREQDQQVIRKYLLAGVPESLRVRVAAGADRLAELERELAHERQGQTARNLRVRLTKALAWLRACRSTILRRRQTS